MSQWSLKIEDIRAPTWWTLGRRSLLDNFRNSYKNKRKNKSSVRDQKFFESRKSIRRLMRYIRGSIIKRALYHEIFLYLLFVCQRRKIIHSELRNRFKLKHHLIESEGCCSKNKTLKLISTKLLCSIMIVINWIKILSFSFRPGNHHMRIQRE